MALTDEVTARLSAKYLEQITNPDLPGAGSADSTRLSKAATDVEADFKVLAGVAYDNTDTRHVTVAVKGVEAKLLMRGSSPGEYAKNLDRQYREDLKALAAVTGRDRQAPTSDSNYSVENPGSDGRTVYPDFSDRTFLNTTPRRPRGGSESDDT
jgi:hypothetical protein